MKPRGYRGGMPASEMRPPPTDVPSVALLPHQQPPAVVWLVRDPATCPDCPYSGDVLTIWPTERQAAEFARLARRRLVIEKWTVPGHE